MLLPAKAKAKIKDSLKEEKRTIAEEGKYIFRETGRNGCCNEPGIIWRRLPVFIKSSSQLDLLYDIAVKKIDLKELKEFTVHGDKLVAPKPIKPVEEKQEYVDTQIIQIKKIRN